MHVCKHICMHVCIYVNICTETHVCVYIHRYMHTYINSCIHTHIFIHAQLNKNAGCIYHAIVKYLSTTNVPLKCHTYIPHMLIHLCADMRKYINIYASFKLTATNTLTKNTLIHTHHITAVCYCSICTDPTAVDKDLK